MKGGDEARSVKWLGENGCNLGSSHVGVNDVESAEPFEFAATCQVVDAGRQPTTPELNAMCAGSPPTTVTSHPRAARRGATMQTYLSTPAKESERTTWAILN